MHLGRLVDGVVVVVVGADWGLALHFGWRAPPLGESFVVPLPSLPLTDPPLFPIGLPSQVSQKVFSDLFCYVYS